MCRWFLIPWSVKISDYFSLIENKNKTSHFSERQGRLHHATTDLLSSDKCQQTELPFHCNVSCRLSCSWKFLMNFSFSLPFCSLLHSTPLMPCYGLLLGDLVENVQWRSRRRWETKYWVHNKSISCEVWNYSFTFVCVFIRVIEYLKLEGIQKDHWVKHPVPHRTN